MGPMFWCLELVINEAARFSVCASCGANAWRAQCNTEGWIQIHRGRRQLPRKCTPKRPRHDIWGAEDLQHTASHIPPLMCYLHQLRGSAGARTGRKQLVCRNSSRVVHLRNWCQNCSAGHPVAVYPSWHGCIHPAVYGPQKPGTCEALIRYDTHHPHVTDLNGNSLLALMQSALRRH